MSYQTVKLGEICDIERGGSPRPIQNYITDAIDGINWIKIGDATASNKFIYKTKEKINPAGVKKSRMVYEGDFILSNSMSFGRPYIMKTTGCIHDGWLVLRKPKVDSDYLYHILSSDLVFKQFDQLAAGSTVKNININIAKSVEIPLPPLPEQKRIAEVLDKANALREKRRLALGKLDTLLQSVFLEMFGDPVKNPKGWDFDNFGNLCSEIYRYPTYYGIEYVEEGVPEIRGELIQKNGELENNKEKLRFISKETSDKFSRTVLQLGDLVLSVRGTIGKIGFVDESFVGANITANLIRVSPNKTKVNPRYFWQMCRNECFQRKLQEISSSTTIQTLKSPDLKAIKVLLPPFELQERFEKFYQKWKSLHHAVDLAFRNTEKLFQALQQRAFKGELFSNELQSVESHEGNVWQQTSLS